jgi:hypothetical protein
MTDFMGRTDRGYFILVFEEEVKIYAVSTDGERRLGGHRGLE